MLLLLAVCVAGAGCGEERRDPPRKPVQLTIGAPKDGATTREESVEVSGRVVPAASRVLVAGGVASVGDGRFTATVQLREGTNVIDVGASAPGGRATWRAVRVIRRSKVRLPDVTGDETDDAVARLEGLGFEPNVIVDDGLLDAFRRRPRVVCRTDPEPGSLVEPGSEVVVVVSKTC